MGVAGIEVRAFPAENADTTTAELAAAEGVVQVVEGRNDNPVPASLKQAVVVERFSRRDFLVMADANSCLGEVQIGFVLMANFRFVDLQTGMIKSHRSCQV